MEQPNNDKDCARNKQVFTEHHKEAKGHQYCNCDLNAILAFRVIP